MTWPALDLDGAGYTDRGSRLLVRRAATGSPAVVIAEAVYERRWDRCRHVDGIEIVIGDAVLEPTAAPDGVRWADAAHLLVADRMASLCLGRGASVRFRMRLGEGDVVGGTAPATTPGHLLTWTVSGGTRGERLPDGQIAVHAEQGGATVRWLVHRGPTPVPPEQHDSLARAAHLRWQDWFARCPPVNGEWQELVDVAWWQLAANVIRLDGAPDRELVVPSKLGYVAAWQWDSYFISIGLRHGAPELAADQIRFFLDQQDEAGFIPDVVHDEGCIARVADLPRSERCWTATILGQPEESTALGDIPVTKPPLAAWAAALVAEAGGPDLIAERPGQLDRLREWWLARPSPDGLPGFEHPYSSGFDDSPLFDDGAPVYAPDLPSYLVVEADVLAAAARDRGDIASWRAHLGRAEELTARLVANRWDDVSSTFLIRTPAGPATARTPVELLPLLTGRLPEHMTSALTRAIASPELFGAPYPLPTVGLTDPRFDAERMWRGPVWVNVNWLVVQGLRRSGRVADAVELAERTVRMVQRAGGCYEYFRADTAAPSPTAVPGFGWTAALVIDLAVWLARGDRV